MSAREDLQAGLEEDLEPESEVGWILWQGAQIPCLPLKSSIQYGEALGPLIDESKMSFRIRKNAFQSNTSDSAIAPTADSNTLDSTTDDSMMPPSPGHIIVYDQKRWRIDSVPISDTFGAFWLVNCVSENA